MKLYYCDIRLLIMMTMHKQNYTVTAWCDSSSYKVVHFFFFLYFIGIFIDILYHWFPSQGQGPLLWVI